MTCACMKFSVVFKCWPSKTPWYYPLINYCKHVAPVFAVFCFFGCDFQNESHVPACQRALLVLMRAMYSFGHEVRSFKCGSGATNSSSRPLSWVIHQVFWHSAQEMIFSLFLWVKHATHWRPCYCEIESLRHSKTPLRRQRNCRHQQRPQESGRKSQRLRHRIAERSGKHGKSQSLAYPNIVRLSYTRASDKNKSNQLMSLLNWGQIRTAGNSTWRCHSFSHSAPATSICLEPTEPRNLDEI